MYPCVFWCEFIDLVAFLALSCDPCNSICLVTGVTKKCTKSFGINLVEISKDFLIFIEFKIPETGFDSKPVCYFLINILLVLVSMPHAREHPKLCAHLLSCYEYLISLSISVTVLRAFTVCFKYTHNNEPKVTIIT